jgi:hypothetical protein
MTYFSLLGKTYSAKDASQWTKHISGEWEMTKEEHNLKI